jgi:S1-C subfamily serine protease
MLELNIPLNPGVSGAPVVNRDGLLAGMAIGILESDVYGMAAPGHYIVSLLEAATKAVRAEETRLHNLGCEPGVVDGVFDKETWRAYQCARLHSLGP